MGVFAGPEIVEDGLVLALDAGNAKSYPGSGTAWTDLSGNGNTGTLVNGVGFDSGNLGSLSFDGTDDHITLTTNPSLTNQITIEVWVKLEPTINNLTGWICGRESSYRMLYTSTGFAWVCATDNNGWYTSGTAISASSLTPHTKTYQVVVTYDGSNNKIYVNGTLRITGSAISGNIRNVSPYYIMRDGSSDVNIDHGQGIIYSHRIYNRALTAQEIQQNFNATRSRFSF